MTVDYLQYYHLERYLFESVSRRFGKTGLLTAFDFFCIVIWKANRAKSKVAARLLAHCPEHDSLEGAVQALVAAIREADSPQARLAILINDWGFQLPMASAILTVMYPEHFSVYDVRVCDVLGDFSDAAHREPFEAKWKRYDEYLKEVQTAAPGGLSLRDKDRYLWAKSFAQQLEVDIRTGFPRPSDDESPDVERE